MEGFHAFYAFDIFAGLFVVWGQYIGYGHDQSDPPKELIIMPELTEISIDKEIDARGSFCPGPLMELIRGVKALPIGGVVAVLSSDPGSARDIPAWVQKARHEFLGAYPEQGYTRFVARKTH